MGTYSDRLIEGERALRQPGLTCYHEKHFPLVVQPDWVFELGPLLDLIHPVHFVGVLAKLELDRVGEVVETELSGLPLKLPLVLPVLFVVRQPRFAPGFRGARGGNLYGMRRRNSTHQERENRSANRWGSRDS